jgi:hypothetical protein
LRGIEEKNMNVGLGNLTELKGQLLAASLRSDTNYDAVITGIGLGVADLFDQFCNRTFARTVGKTDVFSADRRHWYLNCYPVEEITSVGISDDQADGFTASTLPPSGSSMIQQMQLDQGYVMFVAIQGYFFSRIRVTYTGGYWFPVLEPTDANYPDTQPAGAAPLPAAVKTAWYLQCQHLWKRWDKLGAQIAEDPEGKTALDKLEMTPMVKQLLNPFRRMQMT